MTSPQLSPTTSSNRRLALNALLAGAVGIACAPIFVRFSQVGPSATAFWRMSLAMPFLWLWMQSNQRSNTPSRRLMAKDYRDLALAGVFFACDLGFWHWSIQYTSVANATLLANFSPIFVALGGWFIFKQRVTGRFVLGLVVAIAGMVGLIGGGFQLNPDHLPGDMLGLVTAVFYAAYILWVSRLRQQFNTATVMVGSGLASSLVLLPAAWLSSEKILPVDLSGWWVLLGLALVSQVGGQTLIAYALARLPAAFSSVTLLLQPILAALFAWALLAESLSPVEIAGGMVALVGIFIARRSSQVR